MQVNKNNLVHLFSEKGRDGTCYQDTECRGLMECWSSIGCQCPSTHTYNPDLDICEERKWLIKLDETLIRFLKNI